MLPVTEGNHESLSVFLNVRGLDVPGDLESIQVLCDEAGLAWRLDDGSWNVQKDGADTWIGGAGLAMADYGELPRAGYRVVVTNLGGMRTETSFTVAGEAPATPLPELKSGPTSIRLTSAWPQSLLLAYDGTGALIAGRQITSGEYALAGQFPAAVLERAVSLAAYGYDPKRHFGAYSWRKTKS
jgi:hypothetical protein